MTTQNPRKSAPKTREEREKEEDHLLKATPRDVFGQPLRFARPSKKSQAR